MPKKPVSPDQETARFLLGKMWEDVMADDEGHLDPELNKLINSKLVSIRYCLPTQLLGKVTDSRLDCVCLQKGDGTDESKWDPRGFSQKVIVPWVSENQNVLGTSGDPYVGNPMRIPRLLAHPGNVKGKDDWELLYAVLDAVQQTDDPAFTKAQLIETLRCVKAKLIASSFEFIVPERISLAQTEKLIQDFLSEASGGDRGLSVAAALLLTVGRFFQLYSEVRRHVINASDASTGLTADIECIDVDGKLRLAVEVKERSLTLMDLKGAIVKARKQGITEFLFNVPQTSPNENDEIEELISRTWASGTNLYRLSIHELLKVVLTVTGEEGRRDFLFNVGEQLNEFNTQPTNRQRWKELLESI